MMGCTSYEPSMFHLMAGITSGNFGGADRLRLTTHPRTEAPQQQPSSPGSSSGGSSGGGTSSCGDFATPHLAPPSSAAAAGVPPAQPGQSRPRRVFAPVIPRARRPATHVTSSSFTTCPEYPASHAPISPSSSSLSPPGCSSDSDCATQQRLPRPAVSVELTAFEGPVDASEVSPPGPASRGPIPPVKRHGGAVVSRRLGRLDDLPGCSYGRGGGATSGQLRAPTAGAAMVDPFDRELAPAGDAVVVVTLLPHPGSQAQNSGSAGSLPGAEGGARKRSWDEPTSAVFGVGEADSSALECCPSALVCNGGGGATSAAAPPSSHGHPMRLAGQMAAGHAAVTSALQPPSSGATSAGAGVAQTTAAASEAVAAVGGGTAAAPLQPLPFVGVGAQGPTDRERRSYLREEDDWILAQRGAGVPLSSISAAVHRSERAVGERLRRLRSWFGIDVASAPAAAAAKRAAGVVATPTVFFAPGDGSSAVRQGVMAA